MVRYFTAIAYRESILDGDNCFLKYHNIRDNPATVAAFCKMLKEKFPTVLYVNLYDKKTRAFVERIYLE